MLARTAGWRNVLLRTSGPTPIRLVRAATAASTVPASKHGPAGSPYPA